jgi:hypothetical protein
MWCLFIVYSMMRLCIILVSSNDDGDGSRNTTASTVHVDCHMLLFALCAHV